MFCDKCGNQMDDNAKFCTKCGAVVESADRTNPKPAPKPYGNGGNQPQMVQKAPKKSKNPFPKKLAVIGAIVAAAIVAIVIVVNIMGNRSTKIDLNKYLQVEFEGYDGYGTADVTFDEEAFYKNYDGKIKMRKGQGGNARTDLTELFYYNVVYDAYTVENNGNLSNGDTLQITWNLNQENLNRFNVECNVGTYEIEVQDLLEAESFDPFAGLKYSVSGVSGEGVLQMEVDPDSGISVKADKAEGLSNGDVVTLTAYPNTYTEDWNEYISENGKTPSETTMEVTVDGLAKYLDDASQLTEEIRASMEKNGANTFQNQQNTVSLWFYLDSSTVEYLGYYVLTAKGSYSDPANRVVFVYKKSDSYSYEDENVSATYYKAISWDNVMVQEDGSCTVDLTKGKVDDASWKETPKRIDRVDGYMSVDDLYQSEVGTQLNSYNCASFVSAG